MARSFSELLSGRLQETALGVEIDYAPTKKLDRMISEVRPITGAYQVNVSTFVGQNDGLKALLNVCSQIRWEMSEVPLILNGPFFPELFETPEKQVKLVFHECQADAIIISDPTTAEAFTRKNKKVFVTATPEITYRPRGFDNQIGYVVKEKGPNLTAVRFGNPDRVLLIEYGDPKQLENLVINGQDNRGGNFIVMTPNAIVRDGPKTCEMIAQQIEANRVRIP